MRLRDFIAGLASAAAWPLVARAQPSERIRRIGVLSRHCDVYASEYCANHDRRF